jgi:hypothetical protein
MGTHELRLVLGCSPWPQSWHTDGPSCSWKRPHWLHDQQHASFACRKFDLELRRVKKIESAHVFDENLVLAARFGALVLVGRGQKRQCRLVQAQVWVSLGQHWKRAHDFVAEFFFFCEGFGVDLKNLTEINFFLVK